jgi:mono/diheme cytochrome c family protein
MGRNGSCAAVMAAVAATATLAACGGTEPGDGRLAFGKEIYARECARCHMIDGGGVPGVYPNLAGDPIVRLSSPEPMISIVLEGREAMAAFSGQLPVQELAAVMTYVRRAWGNDRSPVTAAQAK